MTPPNLYKLRRYTVRHADASFFTCARPGRKKSSVDRVPDEVVRAWVLNVCSLGPKPAIVSLLGQKQDGMSEYSFYSFFGGCDLADDHPGKPSFRDRVSGIVPDIVVLEHPTIDSERVPTSTLDAVEVDVRSLLAQGRTVVIIDSGGETRTGQVCKHLDAFPTVP